jgi:hypothetical protein
MQARRRRRARMCRHHSGRSPCATPFADSLLQVRHPLRRRRRSSRPSARAATPPPAPTAPSSSTRSICCCRRPTAAALPAAALPPSPEGPQPQAAPEGRGTAGDCARRFGWFWVNYVRTLTRGTASRTRVCVRGAAAGGRAGRRPGPRRDGGRHAAKCIGRARGTAVCAAEAAAAAAAAAAGQRDGTEAAHGRINSRNAGKRRVVLSMAGLAALDARLWPRRCATSGKSSGTTCTVYRALGT